MIKAPFRSFAFAALFAAAGGMSACAGVDFYSDSSLTKPTGIPIFYAPKPYLLVARPGKVDKPLEITVIYVTDPHNVIWAKPKSGWGSANLQMTLQSGQLVSFGQSVDTKIPETINSLAGLLSARAATARAAADAPDSQATFELYEIVQGSDGATTLKRVQMP